MLSPAVCVGIALLLPCYASPASRKLRVEDRDLSPAANLWANPLWTATRAASGNLALVPKGSNARRLDESLARCDGFVLFTTHVITTHSSILESVGAADLDGDGDLDVLFASTKNVIAWYENLDGAGDFAGPQRVITTQAIESESVSSADLDGDGDLDVLFRTYHNKQICWYENLDGAGDFSGPLRVIATLTSWVRSVVTADLDGDGDLDVVWEHYSTIVWAENLDGAGNFSGQLHVITTQVQNTQTVAVADIDGDFDLDVLSASRDDDKIAWYENLDGAGDFSGPQRIITTLLDGALFVAAADLDGDGDLDVLSASQYDDKIAWCENVDGAGNFSGPVRIISTDADGFADSVAAADLDGDGDLDVLSASYVDDYLVWYKNLDGTGSFWELQPIITNEGAFSVSTADLDGDADLDVLSAFYSRDGSVAWYQNECEPMTSQPTPAPTTAQPSTPPQPTPEPTFWGPQVFGKKPQTVGFQRLCVAWCIIFCIISVGVLGYVVHASQKKGKNLARIILTIVLSQYDYGSDTLFIGFQNFATPALFVAALLTYFIPLAVFIVVYRRVVSVHLARIYTLTKAHTIVRSDSLDRLPKYVSYTLFALVFIASTIVYLMLLSVFISCKLMTVSCFAVKFFEAGGFECTQDAFEVTFKRNILSELVFESSGELIIVLVDYSLRAQQNYRSNTGFSTWALLSFVGSSLMIAIEAWPYVYHIVLMGRGLNAGISAISTHLLFTPDQVVATWLIDRLGRSGRPLAPNRQPLDGNPSATSNIEIQVHNVRIVEVAEEHGH